MSIIDGGAFRCGNCKPEFVTSDPEQWAEHIASHANDPNVKQIRSGGKKE